VARWVVPSSVPAPTQVSQAFKEELHPDQQTALIAWVAFTVAFVTCRIITHRIRKGDHGVHNITVGGVHLHHYLWGILSVSIVGGVALRGDGEHRRHGFLATAYGVGLALIVDEFALLLDLKDVYWAKQGRWSVDLAIALISSTGALIVGRPVIERLRRERHQRAA
jgi:hypothetical protein